MPRRQPLPVRLPHRLLAAATAVVVTGSLAIAVLRRRPPPQPPSPPPTTASASAPTSCRRARTATPPSPASWHQAFGTLPAHSADQLDKYANLVYGYTGLTDDQISAFFNDASFGVPADQVESTTRPRSDVTIVRDKATGIPHITGTTRSGTMFGAGYAGAQDRLFADGPAAARRARRS